MQDIIAIVIVVAAVVSYAASRWRASQKRTASDGCGGCHGCEAKARHCASPATAPTSSAGTGAGAH